MSKTFGSSSVPQPPSRIETKLAKNAFSDSTTPFTQPLTPVSIPSPQAGPSTWQAPANWANYSRPTVLAPRKPPKVKARTAEEHEITQQTAARFASRLVLDHAAALYPEVDTPFTDTVDVVNRLLPYHIFQQPKEDLNSLGKGKGKGKASDSDLRGEITETKFALECFKRRQALRDRFRNVRIRSGKRSGSADQALFLAQAVLEADRTDTTYINSQLRNARSELEKIEKDKRLAALPTRPVYYSPQPAPSPSNAQPQYYRGYPYSYAQPYGASSAPAATNNYAPYQSGVAIPVQLPVASLPALHALGIVPVPATSLPPADQPQPPAVLRSSTANGTMLSLEINVSLLQSAQMSGLAMMLNSLMSRTSASATASVASGGSGTVGHTPSSSASS